MFEKCLPFFVDNPFLTFLQLDREEVETWLS